MDLAKAGANALAASDPATAVTQYTKALCVHPTSPDYLSQRSTAFARLQPPRYDLALKDAELAVLCARKRSSRKHIQAAQLRRVVGLYHNGRYAEAKFVLGTMQKWLPKESNEGDDKVKSAMSGASAADSKVLMETKIWLNKVTKRLAEHPQPEFASDNEYPDGTEQDIAESQLLKLYKSQLKADGTFDFAWKIGQESSTTSTSKSAAATATATATATTAAAVAAAAPITTASAPVPTQTQVRHEWYQNSQSVIITLYAKGVPKDKAQIDIQDDSLSISFPQPSNPTAVFSFTLDPLHALIDASKSTANIMSTKIEITLRKASPGVKWPALEGTDKLQKLGSSSSTSNDTAAKAAVLSSLQSSGQQPITTAPAYPTSSKSGPKNWDKLANDLTSKKKKTKTEKDNSKDSAEDDDDGIDDDEFGGDPVDGFFKKLYKDADPDTRRAMMKSFQESNGTALSTNWAEVGSKRYDPVEEKKEEE